MRFLYGTLLVLFLVIGLVNFVVYDKVINKVEIENIYLGKYRPKYKDSTMAPRDTESKPIFFKCKLLN